MGEVGDTPRARYRAFISYSHRDAAFGRRLHGRLERYALPRRLVGRLGRLGPVPARLSPIFRDREELSAAGDLSAEVRAALADSAVLVVVCSPAAAASVWVGKEIETFRALHPDRPVLVALAAGEPGEAFHPALISGGGEPLAADFRREGDGPRLALLKLAAGIAGVGLDELVQRDAQRRVARVTAVTGVSVAAMLAMGVMTAVALDARAEAERQRAEAEGLVGFMLTDLRERLKGQVRLEVMSIVNQRSLDHFARQDLSRLPASSLDLRARALHAMGDDDMQRGDFDRALARFRDARRTTAALLASAPNDPRRIYSHAQSEFWVASVHYERGQWADAKVGFQTYSGMIRRLIAMDPASPVYRRELGYSEVNLCVIAGKGDRDFKAALRHCETSLSAIEAALRSRPHDLDLQKAQLNSQAWLADAWRANGDPAKARAIRLDQERLVNQLIAARPDDMDLRETWVVAQRALARLEVGEGNRGGARIRLIAAKAAVEDLVANDPENQNWKELSRKIASQLDEI